MATILPIQSASAQFQQQAPTPSAQDPLFEALAKYITGGPGPSSVTAAEIQDIIESHTQPGGRAYLESIVNPVPASSIKVWENHATATGFVSTNLSSMTVFFTATRNMIFQKLEFRGTVPGFYPPQVFTFDDEAKFYWDKLANDTPARIEVNMLQNVSIFTIRFYNNDNQAIGELLINKASLRLPEHTLSGTGTFKFLNGPQ